MKSKKAKKAKRRSKKKRRKGEKANQKPRTTRRPVVTALVREGQSEIERERKRSLKHAAQLRCKEREGGRGEGFVVAELYSREHTLVQRRQEAGLLRNSAKIVVLLCCVLLCAVCASTARTRTHAKYYCCNHIHNTWRRGEVAFDSSSYSQAAPWTSWGHSRWTSCRWTRSRTWSAKCE